MAEATANSQYHIPRDTGYQTLQNGTYLERVFPHRLFRGWIAWGGFLGRDGEVVCSLEGNFWYFGICERRRERGIGVGIVVQVFILFWIYFVNFVAEVFGGVVFILYISNKRGGTSGKILCMNIPSTIILSSGLRSTLRHKPESYLTLYNNRLGCDLMKWCISPRQARALMIREGAKEERTDAATLCPTFLSPIEVRNLRASCGLVVCRTYDILLQR